MKKLILLFLSIALWSCTSSDTKTVNTNSAKGGKFYGGTLHLNENDPIESLFPLHISDPVSARTASQIYEGLFKLDPQTLEIEKCLVQSYKTDSTNTLYTFTLKDSIFFHNDESFDKGIGRKLTSDDIIFCFTQLCTHTPYNHAFYVFHDLVEGADEYYNLTRSGKYGGKQPSGIKKIDDLSFSIKLKHPSTVFKYILSEHQTYIYPKEYILNSLEKKPNREIGTGPFIMTQKTDKNISFAKNTNYHRQDSFGNKLPFLDQLEITFIENKHVALDSFINLNTDVLYKLPADLLLDLHLHQDSSDFTHNVEETPEMSIDYLGFNLKSKLYRNKNLRKAVAFALDKKKILERSLDGEADEIGNHGITPPYFQNTIGYNANSIKTLTFNKDSANIYLNASRIFAPDEPRNLTLYYNVEGHRNDKVVNTISRELKKNLNIDLLVKPLHQIAFNHAIESGDAELFLSSWTYEYPHPMDHLAAFYSDGKEFTNAGMVYPDVFRYSNPNFNRYYSMAFSAKSDSSTLTFLLKAEQILMDDLPVIPLWYNESYRAKQEYVKDFHLNPLGYRDLRETYIKPHNVIFPK